MVQTQPPMSAPEFFVRAGLKPTTGWKLVRNGLIPVIRPPATRRVLVSHETLERFLAGEFNDAPRHDDECAG